MHDKIGVKNMSDLTIKSIKYIYDAKALTKEQIRKSKNMENKLLTI